MAQRGEIVIVRLDNAIHNSIENVGSVLAILAFVTSGAVAIAIEIVTNFLESNSIRLGG